MAALRPPRASAGELTTAVVASAATAARVSPIFRMCAPFRCRVNACRTRVFQELDVPDPRKFLNFWETELCSGDSRRFPKKRTVNADRRRYCQTPASADSRWLTDRGSNQDRR